MAAKNITEIGAVMCDVGGVGLSKVVIAMLGLKQTFDPRAGARVYAKVARDNAASNKIFTSSLAWDQVRCRSESNTLFDVAYRGNNGRETVIASGITLTAPRKTRPPPYYKAVSIRKP